MLKIFKNISVLILIVLIVSCSSTKQISIKEITGKIYAMGNEPFIKYGIEENDGTAYKIMKSSPVYSKLKKIQGEYCKIQINLTRSVSWDEIYVIKFKVLKKE